MHSFNAQETLEALRHHRVMKQALRYRKSKLSRYHAELVSLRKAGASYPELSEWLALHKRLCVNHTTVMRYLSKFEGIS